MSRFSLLEVGAPGNEAPVETPPAAPARRADVGPMDHVRAAERAYVLGDLEVSLRAYSRALGEDPLLDVAWVGQLTCLLDLGEYREAATWADRGLELAPQSASILAFRAAALGREGSLAAARTAIDQACAVRGGGPLVWWARGDVLVAVDLDSAARTFDRYLEATRRDWISHLRVGRSYLTVREPIRARGHFVQARNRNPDAAIAWFCLGVCYERLGIRRDCLDAFEHAATLNPSHAEFATALARARRLGRLTSLRRRVARVFTQSTS